MSIDPEKFKNFAIKFVKIELDGVTLRFAERAAIARDTDSVFYFWEGRLMSVSNLSIGFNDFRSTASIVTNMTITLRNGKINDADTTLDNLIRNNDWSNRKVTVYLSGLSTIATAEEFDLTTAKILFLGRTAFPNTFQVFNEDMVSFQVVDDRYKTENRLAENVFSLGDTNVNDSFDSLPKTVEGRTIPVIYGDFADTIIVQAGVIEGFPFEEIWTFKVADSERLLAGQDATKSIDFALLNQNLVVIQSTDLPNGEFTVNLEDVTDSNGLISVACSGKTRGTEIASLFGGSSTDLLEHPVEIIYDILRLNLEILQADIDTASFTTEQAVDTTLKARRAIINQSPAVVEIETLSFEFGYNIFSINNQLTLSTLPSNPTVATKTIDQNDLVEGSYEIQTDPNRIYFNSASGFFDQLTLTQQIRSFSFLYHERQVLHKGNRASQFNFNWNYNFVPILDTLGNLFSYAVKPLNVIRWNGLFRLFDLEPNDVLDVDFHVFSSTKAVIRSISRDLNNFTTSLQLWEVPLREIKDYAASASTPPVDYAAADSATDAVYHASSEVITNYNQIINFTTDAAFVATVLVDKYDDADALATAIQTAMNLVSTVRTLTVTYSSSTRRFTIATDDVANFSIEWTTNEELGRSNLGFDTSANDTGAATYSSDFVAIFDSNDTERVSEFG